MVLQLSGKQRRFLRGRGHALKASVHIGKGGIGAAVLRQIEEGLEAHELIKVKILQGCPLAKDACAQAIGEATGAALAQTVGGTLLFYRPHPEKPALAPPGRQ